MADSFFGFDTSLSNINDDEGGGGEGSEDEYDALNDETFGMGNDDFDWEVEHEQLAEQLESSRRSGYDDSVNSQLEASLSQLVLDETDAPSSSTLNTSNVWKHDIFNSLSAVQSSSALPPLKNVCTVEELERQLRQKQPNINPTQNLFQPRFPVMLQRPPALQPPLPLPFPQQQINNIMPPNQIGQNVNQFMQNISQYNQMQQMNMNHNMQMGNNQMGQNLPNGGQFMPNMNQMMPPHMRNNPRMANPMNMTRANFNTNMGPFNNLFRGPMPNQMDQSIMNQQHPNMNQQHPNMNQQHPNMNQQHPNMNQQPPNMNQSNLNQQPNMNQLNMNQPPNMMPPNLNQHLNMNQMPNLSQMKPINQLPTMNQGPQINHQMNQPFPNQPPQITNQNQVIKTMQKNQVFKNNKPLIFTNSSQQKPMTSQNMVQLIQNNHPMLQQYNNMHNANHHPLLNNRFNNQMINHPMFNNGLRVNGGMISNDSNNNNNRQLQNGDDGIQNGVYKEADEYAGLMSQREKQWLLNIQMLQLNTGTPYIDDFYYTVFLERQSRKEKEGIKEAHKANQQNHPFYNSNVKQEQRSRQNSVRHNSTSEDVSTPRTYVPTQFENSLGKLQCGSVTAPRKIIDVDLVPNETNTSTCGRQSRAPSVASSTIEGPQMRRTKQVLLDIEALYLILLRLEELSDPLAISNALILKEREEKQKLLELAQKEIDDHEFPDTNMFLRNIESVQRKPKPETIKEAIDKRQVVNLSVTSAQNVPVTKNLLEENKDDLINKIFLGLLHEDRMQQLLLVRKGKTLLSRFLNRVSPSHPRVRSVWNKVFRYLSHSARRDDGSLALLATHFNKYIQSSSGWSAVLEISSLLSEALDPARTPHALTSTLTISAICFLLEKASTLTTTVEATSNERQWTKFLKTFARSLKNTNLKVAKPVKPLPENKLKAHIKLIAGRSTIEILQRGKTASEFSDLSKTDLSELLTKHLC